MAQLNANWADLEDDLASSQDQLSQDVMRAEACRSSSDSECEDSDSEARFWVKALKKASRNLGLLKPKTMTKTTSPESLHVKVVSGCTGMGAEGFVFKAGMRRVLG